MLANFREVACSLMMKSESVWSNFPWSMLMKKERKKRKKKSSRKKNFRSIRFESRSDVINKHIYLEPTHNHVITESRISSNSQYSQSRCNSSLEQSSKNFPFFMYTACHDYLFIVMIIWSSNRIEKCLQVGVILPDKFCFQIVICSTETVQNGMVFAHWMWRIRKHVAQSLCYPLLPLLCYCYVCFLLYCYATKVILAAFGYVWGVVLSGSLALLLILKLM